MTSVYNLTAERYEDILARDPSAEPHYDSASNTVDGINVTAASGRQVAHFGDRIGSNQDGTWTVVCKHPA